MFASKFVSEHIDYKQRVNIIKENCSENEVGILIKYKDSKAKDETGRFGHGEKQYCRVAILRDFDEDTGKATFETFVNKTFYTQYHWQLEHDNETLDNLDSELVRVDIAELGYKDFVSGTRYHFIRPKSYNNNRYLVRYLDENNNNTKDHVSLARRIKLVMDDWGVDYNKVELDKIIEAESAEDGGNDIEQ